VALRYESHFVNVVLLLANFIVVVFIIFAVICSSRVRKACLW
jgi:hypothetical protein